MSGSIFTTLIAIPWAELLKQAPAIVKAAESLLSGTLTKGKTRATANELATLKERVEALEMHDREDAKLVKQLAEQLEVLTFSTRILASRLKAVLAMAVIGIVIGCSALIFYVIMRR